MGNVIYVKRDIDEKKERRMEGWRTAARLAKCGPCSIDSSAVRFS